ncbi:hypothetical protein ACOI1C_16525 [Bacillus sp. DJP31]|uniref:hypothetical protein n=1 Tax=Bacillus sp. DJP31 TaxID=3409789 RepID=UPI003BB545C8
MKKSIFLIFILLLALPIACKAEGKGDEGKIAFLRNQDLWVKMGEKKRTYNH